MDQSIRAELRRLETALATRDPRLADDLAALIADDFLEHGASGSVWDAAAARRTVMTEPPTSLDIEDFTASELAPDVVLVTYRAGDHRPANRSSIWVRRDSRWQIRFHQGTLLAR